MATQFTPVKPGDVITASQWNQVLAAIEDLYSQIGAVSTTAVAITAFMPPGPVKVQDQVTILGRNFQYSIGAQSVFFGGVPINSFLLGSSDTQLVVNVPELTNLPAQGQAITVTVYNRTSSDSKQITVIPPPLSVSGGASVSALSFTGTPAPNGQPTNFTYTISNLLDQTRSISISALVTPSSLQNSVQVLGTNQQALGQISLGPNVTQSFIVAVTIPAGVSGSLGLTVTAIDVATGTAMGSSGTSNYTIGQASTTDPNIVFGRISVAQAAAGQGNAYSPSNNTISLPANSWISLNIATIFQAAAQYSVNASVSGTAWTATMVNPAPNQLLDFSSGAPVNANVQFNVVTGPNPATTGQLQIQAQTQGQTTHMTSLSFNLALA
jgi:hypothetical protein